MPVTKVWGVDRMDCLPVSEGQTNVVKTVYWRLSATDGANQARCYGTIVIAPYVAGNTFIPYSSLTLAQVLIWAHLAMGNDKAAQEATMDRQISELVTPPLVHPELPWAT
jgi:hypothetical protein